MNKFQKAFQNGKAYIGFITCGDPDLATTEKAVLAAAENGADIIELNIKVLGEGTRQRDFSDCEILHYIRAPFKWTTLYDEVYWDFIDPYFMKFYSIIEKIYWFFR